jgi:hypothetical protein
MVRLDRRTGRRGCGSGKRRGSDDSGRLSLPRLWAIARYDLRLTGAEFYALTPRQFTLLCERHRESLAHREMIGAYITTAVKNFSMCPPEEPAAMTDYMPSHRAASTRAPELSEEDLQRQSDWNIRVAELAAAQMQGKS